jgi:transposase InsO family protein
LYEWNVTPFGLTGAPATFQRYINRTLQEYLDDFVSAYVDDIIIYSSGSLEDHQRKVGQVLQKLQDAGLQCDIGKSEFEQDSVKYLGFIVRAGKGIHVDPKKVTAIREWEAPKSVRDIRSFLGFANFYRPFIPRFADLSAPLTRLIRKDALFSWNDDCQRAFEELKDLFINAPILAHLKEDRETVVEADASGWATGAVLSQYGSDGQLRPYAYLSQKLSPAESNYEIHDKELLAIIRALREWRPELKMVPRFTIVTDHKNLRYFGKAQHLNERQMRWADVLTEFNYELKYRPGKLAARPDALSRRSQDTPQHITDERLSNRFQILLKKVQVKTGRLNLQTVEEADFEKEIQLFEEPTLQQEWKNARSTDQGYQKICEAVVKGDRRIAAETHVKTSLSECHLDERGLLCFRKRIWVPDSETLRTGIIQKIHDSHVTAHPGRDATYAILSRRFFWPGAAKDVRRFLRNCTVCGRSTVWRDTKHGLLKPLPIPQRIWAELSMDFITELPPTAHRGATNLMVITDRLTKSVILVSMVETTAERVADAFFTHFYMHHGLPRAITSDRGPQFVGAFWRIICEKLSIQRRLTTAFHPQSDGATERANQEVERILRAFTTYTQDDWDTLLPIVATAINNRNASATGLSPFFFTWVPCRSHRDRRDGRISGTPHTTRDRGRNVRESLTRSHRLGPGRNCFRTGSAGRAIK